MRIFVWPGNFTIEVILAWWKVDNHFLHFALFKFLHFLCLLKLQLSRLRGNHTALPRGMHGDVTATWHGDSRRHFTATLFWREIILLVPQGNERVLLYTSLLRSRFWISQKRLRRRITVHRFSKAHFRQTEAREAGTKYRRESSARN